MTAAVTPRPFAELAEELRIAAHREACGAEVLEDWSVRGDVALIARNLIIVREHAQALAEAHHILRALAAHEGAIRELLRDAMEQCP